MLHFSQQDIGCNEHHGVVCAVINLCGIEIGQIPIRLLRDHIVGGCMLSMVDRFNGVSGNDNQNGCFILAPSVLTRTCQSEQKEQGGIYKGIEPLPSEVSGNQKQEVTSHNRNIHTSWKKQPPQMITMTTSLERSWDIQQEGNKEGCGFGIHLRPQPHHPMDNEPSPITRAERMSAEFR
ncbi:hypothetical protein R1flu_005658 [Riccia fluitans]|uniref:Uncharacterized protein n=1 Tax=Riccia fluitans TaxID=41844 RepID=A0ABD1YWJ8_9MARC